MLLCRNNKNISILQLEKNNNKKQPYLDLSTHSNNILVHVLQEHIEKAISLKPDDPSNHHLLGRWCYTVSIKI